MKSCIPGLLQQIPIHFGNRIFTVVNTKGKSHFLLIHGPIKVITLVYRSLMSLIDLDFYWKYKADFDRLPVMLTCFLFRHTIDEADGFGIDGLRRTSCNGCIPYGSIFVNDKLNINKSRCFRIPDDSRDL